jgi:hypothetical protein
MTWISKLSKTKKRWENHRKSIIGEIWWNGARKTNNHAVLGDLLEDGLLLSDVSAMSQRCLPSPPCRRGVCKMPLEGRDGFQTSDDWSWIHRVFIMISSRWTFHHFHLIRISWWILDESHDSSWLLRFFLIRTTISVWKNWWISWLYKPASPAVSRRQMSVTFQIGGETRLWAEFHEFLTPCPKNLKVKGYQRCKPRCKPL